MNEGKILLEGAPDVLVQNEVGQEVVELWNVTDAAREFIEQQDWPMESVEDRLYICDRAGGEVAHAIESRFPEQDRQIRHATLEDVFLRRTGRALKD
jgi:ABC-type multidrug transport system ATPase subunit